MTTTKQTISKYCSKAGVELEGGWTRFKSLRNTGASSVANPTTGCDHECSEDCMEHNCEHDCRFDEDCYTQDCQHNCEDECEELESGGYDCSHNCDFAYARSMRNSDCWYEDCQHNCGEDCYSDCNHDCEDEECQILENTTPEDRNTPLKYQLNRFNHYKTDASLSGFSGCNVMGEVVSPPCSNLRDLAEFIQAYYPDKVNTTSGLHIHVSLESDEDYTLLMQPSFYSYFRTHVEAWAKANKIKSARFWNRFNNQNYYCARNDRKRSESEETLTEAEMLINHQRQRNGSADRYRHLNFCKGKHGTLEVRLFNGLNNPREIFKSVLCVLECIDTYLEIVHTASAKLAKKIKNSIKTEYRVSSGNTTVTVTPADLVVAQ